jgi:hypothetical protein
MSSPSAPTMPTKSSITAITGALGADSSMKSTVVFWLSVIVVIAMFITAFVKMSYFAGSKDDWNDIQPKITEILIYTLIGVFAFAVASLLYFVQNPEKSIYFAIVLGAIAIGLSFSGLAIACITR